MRKTYNILPRRQAFTLTEMIIAVTIGIVIMLGVNQIFQTTSNTITSGLALAEINRNLRGAQAIFYNDIRGNDVTSGMAPIRKGPTTQSDNGSAQTNTAPFLFIYCHIANDASPAYLNADEKNSGLSESTITKIRTTYRSDILSFFSTGQFQRQTSDDNGVIPSGTTKNQAYITYAHLKLPGSDGNYYLPADTNANNTTNKYATQWILGRSVILLGGPASGLGSQWRYERFGTNLAPLSVNSYSSNDGTLVNTNPQIQDSRYDLAATDFATYSGYVATADPSGSPNSSWAESAFNYHFQANPNPAIPLTGDTLAKSIPPFILNCTDFAVDFAGDFNQDGQIDLTAGGQIQWYGLPHPPTGPLADPTVKTVGTALGTQQNFEYSGTSFYCCAWGAGDGKIRPKLIRITVSVFDAKGRVNLPVTHQYVFSVP